ncbi:MAG TPA: class E sortase, partial [Patescibacteria group bacterium]|nr:class E sortase [Patescibacteria group bacterium]
AQVWEGQTEATLLKGIWRIPYTSTPDKGGNTVFTAHRWLQTSGPKTFYHLDKVNVGDVIRVLWEGKEYKYAVVESRIVEKDEIDIEYNTLEPVLTLYTCTPLWTSSHRIVVRARLLPNIRG